MAKRLKLFTVKFFMVCLIAVLVSASAVLCFSVRAAEREVPSLAQGQYVKWVDRVELLDYAKEFYSVCIEAADNDGYCDFFIQDCYFQLAPEKTFASISLKTLQVGSFIQTDEFTGIFVGAVPKEERVYAFQYIGIAFQAFLYDYPEVFWLNGQWQRYHTDKNTGMVYLFFVLEDQTRPSGFRYDGYTETVIQKAIAEQNMSIEKILKQMPEEAVQDVDKVAYFHDFLVENNEYNTIVAALAKDQETREIRKEMPIVWEGICALSGNIGEQGPVCYSYAEALKVLCDRVGVPCVITCKKKHVWNSVQIEGKWYAVDVMRDDPAYGSGAVSGFEHRDYFLVGTETLDRAGVRFMDTHPVENEVWMYPGM